VRRARALSSAQDRAAVRDNPDVVDASRPLRHLLVADFWGTPATNLMSNKSWRPLTIAFYRLVRRASAVPGTPLSPRPYHAANVALHAAVSWQLAVLTDALGTWAGHPAPALGAAAAGLLFAMHPAHVEAVAGLVGAAELLCALFYLLALRFYAAAAVGGRGRVHSCAALAAALVLAAAATLSKETGFTALGAFAALDWLMLPSGHARAPPAARLAALVTRGGALAAFAAAYLAARDAVTGGRAVEVETWRVVDNHLTFLPGARARGLTVAHSHWRYVRLLLLPHPLCADWNYACIPPVLDWRDARNAGAAVAYAAAAVAVMAARPWRGLASLFLLRPPPAEAAAAAAAEAAERAARPRRLRLFLLAALGLCPFAPASNALVFVGAYLAERLLYLPSAGFCIWLGLALTAPRARAPAVAAAAAAAVLLLGYAVLTAARVPDWRSDGTLFTADAVTCPTGVRLRFNAGLQARLAGDCAGGAVHQRASLAILPHNNCGPYYELGTCAYNAGKGGEAADHFERALGCVDTAKNAAEALRLTLSELYAGHPGAPAVLLAFARIAPRVDPLDGPAAACAAAGRAAELLRAARGPAFDVSTAALLCPAGAAAAAAAANNSLFALEGSRSCEAGAAAAASEFVAAHGNGGGSGGKLPPAAASAVASSFVRTWGVACRSHAGYAKAVNALQRADPYNADLHMEWARLLRWGSLTDEDTAARHAQFAVTAYDAAAAAAGHVAGAASAAASAAAARAEIASWTHGKLGPPSVTQLVDAPLTKAQLRALLPHMYGGKGLGGGAKGSKGQARSGKPKSARGGNTEL
jgi:tetratricopeptide (TPR) repeat protein